jgi:ABC-type phosphate transport system substrate-binding protein
MLTRLLCPLFASLALLAVAPAHAGEVIVNNSVTLTPDEIRDVFLGEKQLANGVRLVPVDNSEIQEEFLSKVLQTDSQKYYARWTRKSFREGLTAPDVKGSDAEVIAFVKRTRGAVGYVRKPTVGMKVVQDF